MDERTQARRDARSRQQARDRLTEARQRDHERHRLALEQQWAEAARARRRDIPSSSPPTVLTRLRRWLHRLWRRSLRGNRPQPE